MAKKEKYVVVENVSNCCQAKIKVIGTPDFYIEGDDEVCTCYYLCTKCERVCDGTTPKSYSTPEGVHNALNSKYNLWDYIEIFWYRYFWNYVSEIPLNIKSFVQRGIRGYSDRDCWDFDSYLEDVIEGGANHLLLHTQYSDSKRIDNLTKIIDTMKIARDIKDTYDKDLMNYRRKEFKKGMKVLADKWYELWD